MMFCEGVKFKYDVTSKCDDITMWAALKCFPVGASKFTRFYEEDFADDVLKSLANSGSYFVHIYNKQLDFYHKTFDVSPDSKAAYIQVAKVYCPRTFATGYHF